ncbi:phosphate ABC transporter substrate-binding protein [Vibrio zhanjiangensis]|uniref:Phosphate ABC transporter substrate-binding protein n=1 Tax=Vibrio zhanjiangensis TaxID=1046128 RepID=A0ABQ6EZ85_9VIBR|nr:phosphate/phosphite/phosphonate ABC transporter substrate-binding protein [Vibrio zhanjiangensis]GLT18011.1 phosphate ABC transporter substrate-binding protein [Vibrio zhanjiangensis]
MKKYLAATLLTLLPSLSLSAPLTFGVVPQQSASRLAQQWAPIVSYLSSAIGQEVIFATTPDIPSYEEKLAQGEFDIAYMNPYHYTVFSQAPGYRATAKAKDKVIKGIIVVRKDSQITELTQLQNQKLAFPSPAAFAATILTQSYLKSANIEFTPSYVSSHDSVYLSVAKGFFPAGGGILRTFNALPETTRKQLVPIWTTKGFTPHAIAVHPRITAETELKLKAALEQLHTSPMVKTQLEQLKIKGFVSAQDSDWDDVRALNIKILD